MDDNQVDNLIEQMRHWGIIFDRGLSSNEIAQIESNNGFSFPEDLKAILQRALPIWEPDYERRGLYVEEVFPNWRTRASLIMRKSRNYLLRGLHDAIQWGYEHESRGFWLESWGPKPSNLSEALAICEREFAKAPILVPVYAHRFIPTDPQTAGNPVFSIAGVDIIHYGYNLTDYFYHEFEKHERSSTVMPRAIRFWSDFTRSPLTPPEPHNPINLKDVDLDRYNQC